MQHLLTCSSQEIDYKYCYRRFHYYATPENQNAVKIRFPTIPVNLPTSTHADEFSAKYSFQTLTVFDFPGAVKTKVSHLNFTRKNIRLCGHFFLPIPWTLFLSHKTLSYPQSVLLVTRVFRKLTPYCYIRNQLNWNATVAIHAPHCRFTCNPQEIVCIYSFEL